MTEVGFYARRLREEEVTRRMTVVFVAMAVVIQSLTIFSPPESANASSEQDLIRGGVTSLEDLLIRYDKNSDDIRDIYTTLGIERDELAAARQATVNSKQALYSISRFGQYSPDQGETSFRYKRSAGGEGVRFISLMSLADTNSIKQTSGTRYSAWVGQSTQLGWFAIIQSNASVATKGYPATITPQGSVATSPIAKTLTVHNLTQDTVATDTIAQPFDKISYTITVDNTSDITVQPPLSIALADTLEYASLIDDGGGHLDSATKILSWNTAPLAAGASQQRTFAIQLFSHIPATPTGSSNGNSYDCVMAATFGSSTAVRVACPTGKTVEGILGTLPQVGTGINIFFSLVVAAITVYFYLRTRQMKKELRLIRHNINVGTI
ncbi:MAG: hypothetical protein WAS27_02955 [Candidatus Saccharimonadales bacterium]